MDAFLILGQVPGTDYQITFNGFVMAVVSFFAVRLLVKQRHNLRTKLPAKLGRNAGEGLY